jgi:O-glycosyl hydrolase
MQEPLALVMKRTITGLLGSLLLLTGTAGAATVTIDGAQTYQTIDGFGVNANSGSWTNNELQPVLDALIDQAGMTLFLAIYAGNCNWEATNANTNGINWPYFDAVYSAPVFQQLWGMMAYLNQRGISDGVMPKFGGPGPLWMGGTSLTAGYENACAQMIASALIYARDTQHLQFTVAAPLNEPDININTGIHLSGSAQYVTVLHDLGQQLDTNGASDLRFSGPELANTSTSWLAAMMADSYLMSKVAHFGLHSYVGQTADASGVSSFIQQSPYPGVHFWMTEFGVWCASCLSGTAGNGSWTNAQGTASALLNHLANGASAGLTFEAWDSVYAGYNASTGQDTPGQWSLWGLFAVDDKNAVTKTYTPRKQFYTLSQITRYVRPGAQRINVSGSTSPLTLLAFYHPAIGQLTLTGVNTTSSSVTLSGTLTSLPTVSSLELYYTDSTTNLSDRGAVPITSSSFVATVPANCVFTLVGSTAAAGAPVITQALLTADGFILRGTNGVPFRNYRVLSTTNVALPQTQWTPLATNAFGPSGYFDCTNAVAPADGQHYLRVVMTNP